MSYLEKFAKGVKFVPEIKPEWIVAHPLPPTSHHVIMVKNAEVERVLKEIYGRSDLALKVFFTHTADVPLQKFNWCSLPLRDCSTIQNLFAFHGVAPRVLDVIRVQTPTRSIHYAQVTEWVEGNRRGRDGLTYYDMEKHERIKKQYGIKEFPHPYCIGSKMVDFQGFTFIDRAEYEKQLLRKPFHGDSPYEWLDEFGIKGARASLKERSEGLQFDQLDFNGKTVLDLGCNLGSFSREAFRRGAKRVVAVDKHPPFVNITFELANYLGFWNQDALLLDFEKYPEQIEELTGIKQFDIVLALSVVRWVTGGVSEGCKSWLADFTKDYFILEGHSVGDSEKTYRPQLEAIFKQVEFLGCIEGGRPMFRCRK